MHRGGCLCGAVRFEVSGTLPDPVACHCAQCRKQSGHYWASTDVPDDRVTIRGEEHLRWYRASDKARRGFCSRCGGFLFWVPDTRPVIAIAMGAFDAPTHARLAMHIFTGDKGDYYDIADGLPQSET